MTNQHSTSCAHCGRRDLSFMTTTSISKNNMENFLIDEKSELDSSKSTEMISIQDSYVDTETLNIDSLKSTETQEH